MTTGESVGGIDWAKVSWRRARRCGESSCVEVATVGGEVAIRDSKRPEVEPLLFTREEWVAFRGAVGAGEFDDLS